MNTTSPSLRLLQCCVLTFSLELGASAAPSISSYLGGGATDSAAEITVNGSGFGVSGASVKLGPYVASPTSQTDTTLKFNLPEGQGGLLPLSVVVGPDESNSLPFSYNPPVIFSTGVPIGGPTTAGGVTIYLSGLSMGVSGATVTLNGLMATVTSQSHSLIGFNLPAGQGANLPLKVTVGGQTSNTVLFSYNPPVINSIGVPIGGPPTSGGVTIGLEGSDFGSSGATINLNGNVVPADTQSHTSITFTLPAGEGANLPLTVTVAGRTSNLRSFTYNAPTILGMVPAKGLASEQTEVVLSGSNFGFNPSVTFGGVPGTVTAHDHSSITVNKPVDLGGDLNVLVNVASQTSSSINFHSVALTSLPGYYIDLDTEQVVPAPPGKFTAVANATSATPASPGFYTPIPGMSAAIPASPGYYVPDPGMAEQLPAPLGKFCDTSGMQLPFNAPVGKYAPVAGMSESIPASPGYYVPDPGSDAQTPAEIGRFVDQPGAMIATDAPSGTYAPIAGMSAAIPAPPGTYVPESGSGGTLLVPPGYVNGNSGTSSLTPLPAIKVTAYTLETNGDNSLSFETANSQNYGIFYTENLSDYTLLEFVSGTGSVVTRTFTPPASTTGKRFYVVGPTAAP